MPQHSPGGLRDRWPWPDPGEGAHLDPLGVKGCRIGTELEGEIRRLLQAGELSYNPDGRVTNYSMGLPRTPELL